MTDKSMSHRTLRLAECLLAFADTCHGGSLYRQITSSPWL